MIDFKKLKLELLEDMKQGIQDVINNKIENYNNPFLCINDYDDYLGNDDDKFNTNGWQYDFWKHYKINGVEYILSGTTYYGILSFYKK